MSRSRWRTCCGPRRASAASWRSPSPPRKSGGGCEPGTAPHRVARRPSRRPARRRRSKPGSGHSAGDHHRHRRGHAAGAAQVLRNRRRGFDPHRAGRSDRLRRAARAAALRGTHGSSGARSHPRRSGPIRVGARPTDRRSRPGGSGPMTEATHQAAKRVIAPVPKSCSCAPGSQCDDCRGGPCSDRATAVPDRHRCPPV